LRNHDLTADPAQSRVEGYELERQTRPSGKDFMSEQLSLLPAKASRHVTNLERRASVRYQCSEEISCSSLAPFERLSGQTRDVSQDGVALILDTSIRVGTELLIDLKTRNPGIALTLRARVVHATREAEGSWLVGCKFISTPTEEQILALL
jgi:c-di-GMP-binding flagellar brake protein YcgR